MVEKIWSYPWGFIGSLAKERWKQLASAAGRFRIQMLAKTKMEEIPHSASPQ
jgi:hypothetical protein